MKTPSLLRLGWVLVLALVVAWGVSAFPAPAETEDIARSKRQEIQAAGGQGGGQSGTTLSETMTATGHRTRTFTWTIDKTANPTVLDLVQGQSGTVDYTVTLTKDDGTVRTWIDGQVCITNGGSKATESLMSTLKVTQPPSNDIVVPDSNLDVSAKPVLAAGESHCYPYSINIPSANSGTYKVTADTTIINHSGHLGEPFGPNEAATTTIPATETLVHNTVTVSDTLQGSLGQFSDDGKATYTRTFTCANEGDNPNTASITYDDGSPGPSDSATVTVKCTGGGGGGGCTRTIGYWKNHIEVIKGPPALLPISLGSRQVTEAADAVAIEGTTGSNGIDKLYAQLLAAKLNIKTGADGSAVASTIQAADTFLTGKTSADWAGLTNAQKSQVNGWATTLDNYNNGVTGPGHCP
ncbi:uncharacterized protein BO72DRAFT_26278 [Aspergillus fijiensis CBS 313.89]|uniref:Uncharacterized protein n=1 Tax=Aspergillus fijiensis CBS 313.89 TaxID=1448319 RepID=A0A8G1RVJ2_9EURO|nr:uncharacterized protein BO72DRAFT_26278 [Aspergillus fijiensis CBS 313.89]RAK80004.1 hypothetical protein BO72DRAFT_26278 [Aspergillus fijiensis CBS 313.89]